MTDKIFNISSANLVTVPVQSAGAVLVISAATSGPQMLRTNSGPHWHWLPTTDVELEAALEVSVHAGPLVVGPHLLEAAQVVGEARVRIRHSTPSVDSSPDRTGRCVSPIKPPQTVGRIHELRLRLSDVLVALEVDDGLIMGSVGVVRADGAKLDLALLGLDAGGDALVWGTRQLGPPLPGIVTEVT